MGKGDADGPERLRDIDTSVPHSARVWDYWLGGKDHYSADREAGDQISAVMPGIVDTARAVRGFLVRAVQYVVGEAGIRQLLDIGTGLPTLNNTHAIAQATAPECRIVYADNDPLVLAHARALLTSRPEGVTDYINADLHEPDTIIRDAARTLDFEAPIALMLLGILNHVMDTDKSYTIVNRLLDALPSGSYFVMSHFTSLIDTEIVEHGMRIYNESGGTPPVRGRSYEELIRYFDRVELLEPGVVPGIPVAAGLPRPRYPAPGLRVLWSRTKALTAPAHSDLLEGALEESSRLDGGFSLHDQAIHDKHVVLDILDLVQVERGGQLLEVHDVREVRLGESQNPERTTHSRVCAGVDRNHLQRDVGQLGDLDQMLYLGPHHRALAQPPQRRLVDHGPQTGRLRLGEDFLPCHSQRDPPFGVVGGATGVPELDEGTGHLPGLQQVGYELRLIGADHRAGLLETEVHLEPVGQDVAVAVPPSGLVGLPGHGQERHSFRFADNAVQGEQVGDVTLLEAHPAELHAADLGVGPSDRVSGCLGTDPARFAEPT